LVGIIHNRTRLRNMSRFKLGLGDSFRRDFRQVVARSGLSASAVSCPTNDFWSA
jgi:hypothetical protein